MDAVTLLTTRYSSARLTEPAPSGEALAIIKQAALQVPDHGHLRPWRFVVVNGRKSLEKLGDIFAEAALEEDPSVANELIERARQLPLRAPMVIVCIAKCVNHPKVPLSEQTQSAACAVMAMQQAAFALGFGGMVSLGHALFIGIGMYSVALPAHFGITNAVVSSVTGVVSAVHVASGQPVEYGQPLFDLLESKSN